MKVLIDWLDTAQAYCHRVWRVVIPYLSPAGFKVFAHRGSTEGGAVENTLEAFQFAVDSGVSYLETDVQATKDGIAVLFHDETLERVAGLKSKVGDHTFEELSRIPLGVSSRIPCLREALERFPDAKWNLDFKVFGAIAPAVKVIAETSSEDRVLVSSFSRRRRILVSNSLPTVATSADATTIFFIWLAIMFGLKLEGLPILSRISALQIPAKFGPLKLDSIKFITRVHEAGVELHYWTINDVAEAQRLIALGADGIVTDKGKIMFERFGVSQPK